MLMRAYFCAEEETAEVTAAEQERSPSPASQALAAAVTQLLAFEQVEPRLLPNACLGRWACQDSQMALISCSPSHACKTLGRMPPQRQLWDRRHWRIKEDRLVTGRHRVQPSRTASPWAPFCAQQGISASSVSGPVQKVVLKSCCCGTWPCNRTAETLYKPNCSKSCLHWQDEHWGKERESARTAAIMKAGPERVPNDKVVILMPKPFDNPSQQTIPLVRLMSWPGHGVLRAVPPIPI